MNSFELQMVDMLKELKENYSAVSVRAEFESEGTKLEELLRLKEVSMTAGLGLTLKIGGCESMRDILEARVVGVNCLAAPMVESAYALSKYLRAVDKVFLPEEKKNIEIVCDIETINASDNLEKMLLVPEISGLQGVVIERVDLCFSLGLKENDINSSKVNDIVLNIIQKAKKKNLLCIIGGGVSADSLDFFRSLPTGSLDRYETRKICFNCPKALGSQAQKGILKALAFEVLWLKNKFSYYEGISSADKKRLSLLEERYHEAIDALT
ncbi:MAG: aldolase/citrate lyase family protein [Candidatus Omnitrophota bacterium]|jgi:hypothetical protein